MGEKGNRHSTFQYVLLVLSGLFLLLAGTLICQQRELRRLSVRLEELTAMTEKSSDSGEELRADDRGPFSAVVDRTRGSAVGITVYETVTVHHSGTSFSDPLGTETQNDMEIGHASGVVVGKETVLTCYHVVKDADAVRVRETLDNGETRLLEATVLAHDEVYDLAVLTAPGLTAEAVAIGNSDSLKEGDMIFCISDTASEKLAASVTTGVISGLNRTMVSSNVKDAYVTLFQTDAAINGGSSGGGVFNLNGELVGIVARKYVGTFSSDTQLEGIGMCIPVNEAQKVLADNF